MRLWHTWQQIATIGSDRMVKANRGKQHYMRLQEKKRIEKEQAAAAAKKKGEKVWTTEKR